MGSSATVDCWLVLAAFVCENAKVGSIGSHMRLFDREAHSDIKTESDPIVQSLQSVCEGVCLMYM